MKRAKQYLHAADAMLVAVYVMALLFLVVSTERATGLLVAISIAAVLTTWSVAAQKRVIWWTVPFDVTLSVIAALAWRYFTLANDGRAIMFIATYTFIAVIIPTILRFGTVAYFAKATIRRAMLPFVIIVTIGFLANDILIERREIGEKGASWAQMQYPAWRRIGF